MSERISAQGACLCGAVRIRASSIATSVGACHCGMCRKWAGGPLLAIDCGNEVEFTGAENITRFQSSEWAERGFCAKCGSHLFYFLKPKGLYIMPPGLFDAGDGLLFDHQVFIEEKPDWYAFANETTNMTGAELFAQAQAQAPAEN